MSSVVLHTECPNLRLRSRGKVRDIYETDAELLIVATDRISAFDVVLPNGIPDKGRVLTALSQFWFDRTSGIVPNHLISTAFDDFPSSAADYRAELEGRTMLVRKAERIDVECVVRGYLSGSAWREYQDHGTVCGAKLATGLRESEKLPEPIFTPATKADSGHDENISVGRMAELVGDELTQQLQATSIGIYRVAESYSSARGIILADTKFEFGTVDGKLLLIDEALTPDSSRFWPADDHAPGRGQRSFDKQYVRDYLETLGWDKRPPAPELSEEVVRGTTSRYREAYERLVGQPFV